MLVGNGIVENLSGTVYAETWSGNSRETSQENPSAPATKSMFTIEHTHLDARKINYVLCMYKCANIFCCLMKRKNHREQVGEHQRGESSTCHGRMSHSGYCYPTKIG